jgi:flagellar biosynthesis/type III secretory pathway protein FliH
MNDTSREAVERVASTLEAEAQHFNSNRETEAANRMAALLRALLAERDLAMEALKEAHGDAAGQHMDAFQAGYAAGFDRGQCHGAETMRERAAAEVDTWQGAEPTTEEHPQRLVWAVLKTKAEAIRALPPVQP